MGVVSGLVLFAVIWAMTFLIVLPFRVQTQGDAGEIVPGTHSGAPEQHNLKQKAVVTTIIAVIVWAIIATIILSGWISVRDIDWFGIMRPETGVSPSS